MDINSGILLALKNSPTRSHSLGFVTFNIIPKNILRMTLYVLEVTQPSLFTISSWLMIFTLAGENNIGHPKF